MQRPLKTFIIYASADKQHKDDLIEFLNAGPVAAGLIDVWHDADIELGDHWDATIKDNLRQAEVVLVLISIKSINSKYINHTELTMALERGQAGECIVIPLFLKPVPDGSPMLQSLKGLEGLPKEKPITSYSIDQRDDVWSAIANGISARVKKGVKKPVEPAPLAPVAPVIAAPQKVISFISKTRIEQQVTWTEQQKFLALFDYPMVEVQGGAFRMGSPLDEKNRRDDECQHKVLVETFEIGKYPVTQEQWLSVMGGAIQPHFKGCPDCPMESASWEQVQEFINKLYEKTGHVYRLPTETEWEFAARGGMKSKGFVYAGSNDIDTVAWYRDNAGRKTHPVGTKAANELGIYDMTGNVWEWCEDVYSAYPCDSEQRGNGSDRVVRGGSWLYDPQVCSVANRDVSTPDDSFSSLGFRLARTI